MGAIDVAADRPIISRSDKTEITAHIGAITRVQETVKWLLGSVAAIATVLLAGVQLSDLRDASGLAQGGALVLTLAALVAVGFTIWNAGRVLIAKPVTVGELVNDPSFANVRKTLANKSVGGVQAEQERIDRWLTRRLHLARELEEEGLDPSGAGDESPAASAVDERPDPRLRELVALDTALEAVESIADYIAVKMAYNRARVSLIAAVGLGFVAIAFIVIATPSPAEASVGRSGAGPPPTLAV